MAESARKAKLKDPNSLSHKLLETTDVIHKEAERRPWMVAFFKNQLPRDGYADWLGRQWFVYSALEEVDDSLKDDSLVGHMHSPELHRAAKLEEDLDYWIGSDWRDKVEETPGVKAYAGRIKQVAKEFPAAYVAHQWLRYLGNVLGQDLLRKLVRKAYGETDEGLAFYDYSKVQDSKAYLGEYHKRMNSIDIDLDGKQRVADEGIQAFKLNIGLTDELAVKYDITAGSRTEADKLVDDLAAEHP